MELTRQAAEQGARLVVWPESAVPFYFDHTPALAARAAASWRASAASTCCSATTTARERRAARDASGWARRCSTPTASWRLRYHKIRLVPFGEYVPMQPLLTLGGRVTRQARASRWRTSRPGTEYATGEVDGHRGGRLHLLRGDLPRPGARVRARGAELLVNITNDAWYGRTSAPYQHLAMAAFRAVENGKYLVRAANTGISAVVDPRGRVLERTALFERDRARARRALRGGRDLLRAPRRRLRLGLPGPGGRS